MESESATPRPRRQQNVWGEGARLRDDIVEAARQLLEQEGTEAAVSLRGVARIVGITARSIYAHFSDRELLVDAVIEAIFADFVTAQQAAFARLPPEATPRDRLRVGLRAFVAFSHDYPASSQVLWVRPNPSTAPSARRAAKSTHAYTEEVLAAACPGLEGAELVRRGQLLWVAVYGLAALPPHHPRHEWCDIDELVDELMDSVLRPPRGR